MARFLPQYSALDDAYPNAQSPCDQGWDNQCAIRVSISLVDAGFHLSGYKMGPLCKHGHARGAQSLADYIWQQVRRPKIVVGGSTAQNKVDNKKGILLFKNIEGFRNGLGDHIDIWNGKKTRTGAYFNYCKEVWFWEVT